MDNQIKFKTICLTLLETPNIEANARKHFAEAGLENVAFYYGIHAGSAGLYTKHNYTVDHPNEDPPHNIGAHGVGIYTSFRSLWAAMLVMDYDYFLVVEHDARFHPDWKPRFEQAIRDVPQDFDYLFVGSCCANDKPKTHIKGDIWEVKYPFCNHACLIAKKCLMTLIQTCNKCWAPVDIQLMMEAFPKLKVYTMLPRAADQFNTMLPQ